MYDTLLLGMCANDVVLAYANQCWFYRSSTRNISLVCFVHFIGCVLPTFQPGVTPLHVSCARNSLDVVQLLLSVPGIDVNIKDARNRTPVMHAHDYRILALLKKYTKSCDDFPVHTVTKVVLCGNTGAGKSTLAQVRIIDFKCIDDGVHLV